MSAACWLFAMSGAFFAAIRCRAVCLATVWALAVLGSSNAAAIASQSPFKAAVGEGCHHKPAVLEGIRDGHSRISRSRLTARAVAFARVELEYRGSSFALHRRRRRRITRTRPHYCNSAKAAAALSYSQLLLQFAQPCHCPVVQTTVQPAHSEK